MLLRSHSQTQVSVIHPSKVARNNPDKGFDPSSRRRRTPTRQRTEQMSSSQVRYRRFTGSLARHWGQWKDSTAIHGLSEYDSMMSKIAKAVWTLVILVVGVFCVQQLYVLITAYHMHSQSTVISSVSNAPLPKLGLAFLPASHTLWKGYRALKKSQKNENQFLEEFRKFWSRLSSYAFDRNNPCMVMDRLPPDYEKIKDKQVQIDSNLVDSITAFESFLLDVKFEYVKPSTYYKNTSHAVYSAHMTGKGPVFTLSFPSQTTQRTEYIRTAFQDKHIKLMLLVGDEAGKLGYPHGRKISFKFEDNQTRTVETVALAFKFYKRAKYYCDERYDREGLGCVELCMVDKARADPEKYCVPYMGNLRVGLGLPLCVFNNTAKCLAGMAECEAYCEACSTCKPCRETRGQVSFVSNEVAKTNGWIWPYPQQLVVQVENHNHNMDVIETIPLYGPATFAAQVGGILGLCFGVSILTLAHFLYFCLTSLICGGKGQIGTGTEGKNVGEGKKEVARGPGRE